MRFSRTRQLVGEDGMCRLRSATVVVCGLGGVGSYAFEALVRAGIGHIVAIDADTVEASNINRQLVALDNTVGQAKVEIVRQRAALIHPDGIITPIQARITPENADSLIPSGVGYGVDAIDSLDAKIALIRLFCARGIPFVSCMGAARRLDPTRIQVADIAATQYCPLAKRVRLALRACGIQRGVRCVYSSEPACAEKEPASASRSYGSLSFIPGIIGLTAAGVIINDILGAASSKSTALDSAGESMSV